MLASRSEYLMNNLEQDLLQMVEMGKMEIKNKIPVKLTDEAEVKISLYDISGAKIADLVHNNLGEGEHNIELDPHLLGLAEGNYVYQAEIKSNTGTEKYIRIVSVAH